MNEKKNVSLIELFIFIFSMSFAPQYFIIDLRPFIYIFWILYTSLKSKFNQSIKIDSYSKNTFLTLILLATYSMFIVVVFNSQNHLLYMRYYRSLIALVVIVYYTSSNDITFKKLANAIIMILTLHAIIIIAEIINPNIRSYLISFSGESRRFYPYRANGLVNSYDLAGIYTIMGFIISSLKYLQSKKVTYFYISILFVIATIFTSRLNVLFLIIALIYILKQSVKYNVYIYKILIAILLFILSVFGIGLWSITTDALPFLRSYIFSQSWSNNLYGFIRETYSDDNFFQILTQHFGVNINNVIELVFGRGNEGEFDPGYSNIFNSLGLIGLSITLFYYINQFRYILYKKKNKLTGDSYILYAIICFIFLVIFIGNLKILFFFSTSLFELLSLLIISFQINMKKEKYKLQNSVESIKI